MPLFAGGVKADPILQSALGEVGKKPQNDLRTVFDRARTGFAADRNARGVRGSDYFDQQINQAQDLSERGLQGNLESVLGNTTYGNFKTQRGYDENEALAREIAELNKPSTLEEVLMGLGGGAKMGGSLYSALGSRGTNLPPPPAYGSGANPYGQNPFAPYDYAANW